jgi:group I intron endonuclease
MNVYYLYNSVSEKGYVGQTSSSISNRWNQHKRDARREKFKNYPVYRALKKYGSESFEPLFLGTATSPENLDNLERLWIILLQSNKNLNGYNIGIGGNSGRKHSLETRQKLSLAKLGKPGNKGRVVSPEQREKLRQSSLGNKNCLGRVLSEETKVKIGAKSVGRIPTPETRIKISDGIKAARAKKFWVSRKKKEQD